MDWRTVTFDWNQARAFLVAAEEGSFSAAARALGLTQPTVGRQVAALEAQLGVTLFERVGRTLQLTEAGAGLVEPVRAMGVAASQVSMSAAGQSASLEGRVAITASQVISAYLLVPVLAQLRAEHPGIELELVSTNATSDLRRREADVAVRNFRPQDPQLVARRLRDRTGGFYAATTYLDRVGRPASARDLGHLDVFGFDRDEDMVQGMRQMGFPLQPEQLVVTCPDHLVQWQLCIAGLGVCVMMDDVGRTEPRVERLFSDRPPIPVQMWLTAHRELHTSRRVRVVFDALAELLDRPTSGTGTTGSTPAPSPPAPRS